MKKVERIVMVTQRIVLLACIALGIIVATILGCGETDDPVDLEESAAADTLGVMKMPEMVAAAPSAPQTGFYVKEVGYYADWKLSEPLSGAVTPGTKVFVKVVFSEPVKFVVADDDSARPILYYRTNKKRLRFRIAQHGASGEDFVSGDAKPWGGGTDDYIGKFVIPEDVTGRFRVEIGKWNMNEAGEPLPAFYVHDEELQIAEEMSQPTVQEPAVPEPAAPKPTVQTPAADTIPPTVLSIRHFLDDRREREIGEDELIPAGTDMFTVVEFSEPVTPSITYTPRNEEEKQFTLGQRGGVHWRGLCKPVDAESTTFLCRQYAWEDSYHITVLADTADRSGNPLGEDNISPVVSVGPRVVIDLRPQEEEPEPISEEVGDTTYTFTFEDGTTYPGYNPPPKLQRILNTHPSAKLPFFEEAVKKVEVISWVYLMVWSVYPDSVDKEVAARDRVLKQFDMTRGTLDRLTAIYFELPRNYAHRDAPKHTRYWFAVEYLRLQMQYPDEDRLSLYTHFQNSKHNVIGLTGPYE